MPDSGAFNVKVGGDLAFLAKKEFDGKLVTAEGGRTTVGDLATITVATGKDMYLARASLKWEKSTTTGTGLLVVELKVNGVIKETYRSLGGVTFPGFYPYYFNMRGLKVLAGQIIKLEVTIIGDSTEVDGDLECFEEDTGVDPTS